MGTTEKVKVFIENDDVSWENTAPGIKRKIMSYDDRLMMVKVAFEKGAIGTLHQHYHTQITHIESGKFEVEVSGEKKSAKSWRCILHSAQCDPWSGLPGGWGAYRYFQSNAGRFCLGSSSLRDSE